MALVKDSFQAVALVATESATAESITAEVPRRLASAGSASEEMLMAGSTLKVMLMCAEAAVVLSTGVRSSITCWKAESSTMARIAMRS